MMRTDFTSMFNPRGIAIVGATPDLARPGRQTVHALDRHGYSGGIYPVNPRYPTIGDHQCFPTLGEITGDVDVAVIALQAKYVPDTIAQCGRKGIRFAVVLGGGFREVGPEGAELEDQAIKAARVAGVRFIGPNCLGYKNIHDNVFACFGSITRPPDLAPGPVSALIQSGGYGNSMVLQCAYVGVGFRYLVASGSESDIKATEIIDAYIDDPATEVILAYLEGVHDGRAFMASARRALAAAKPIVIVKAGNTREGKRAAASHTAFMTASYDAYRAAFKQCGVIEVSDIGDAADTLLTLIGGRRARGRRVAVMSGSGGSLVSFADAADHNGLSLPPLAGQTQAYLSERVPSIGSVVNPVDLTAGYQRKENMPRYTECIEAILADPGVDQLGVFLATGAGETLVASANAIVAARNPENKPILVFSALPPDMTIEGRRILATAGVPSLATPHRVAAAMGRLANYSALSTSALARATEREPSRDALVSLPDGPGTLDEHRAKENLRACGLSVTRDVLLDPATIPCLPPEMRFPVAVKIVSRDIAHKSDIGGVKLGIGDNVMLAHAVADVAANVRAHAPGAKLGGVLASEMITDAVETIIGVLNDPVFGPVVVFGLGGVLAETLRDTTYRVAPFGIDTAREMITELRASAIFRGVRGQSARDVEALAGTIASVSEFAWLHRDRVAEMDLNPVMVRAVGSGVAIADALIVLR
jgi:acetyltransferase